MASQMLGPVQLLSVMAGLGTPADRDWVPASTSLRPGFNLEDYNKWVEFRDTEDFSKLVVESLSTRSDIVLGAIADIKRCLETMRRSQSTYHESANRNARLNFLESAPTSMKTLWDARNDYFAGEKDLITCKPRTSRIHIRGYIRSILDACIIDRRDQYSHISSIAIDLYHWLYIVATEADEREHPDCEFSESVRRMLDLEKMWSKVIPQLFLDVSLQTFENRLLIALASVATRTNVNPRMVADTAHILYYMPPEILSQVRPHIFKLVMLAVNTAFWKLLMDGQRSEEAHETIALTVLAFHRCRERCGTQFLKDLYSNTEGSDVPPLLFHFHKLLDPKSTVETVINSAWSAFNLKNEACLDFLWDSVEFFNSSEERHQRGRLRPTLTTEHEEMLSGYYTAISKHYQKQDALQCLNALRESAISFGSSKLESQPLPPGVEFGCSNYSCRSHLVLQPQPGSFQRCSMCKVVRYCSRECQSKHWRGGHKVECSKLVEAS